MMDTSNPNYCLILAGGIGSRLWPVSRRSKPKQFLDLFGSGKTLLQQTYERYAQFMDPSHIYISTNVDYMPLVYEQLPQVDDHHILEEPLFRGTLASVAWGTVVIAKENPKANIIVTPTDHLIINEEKFHEDVEHTMDFVSRNDALVVMGVRPTRPESGYGYIQMSEDVVENEYFRVKSFTEKPERQFAEIFMQDGGFLWNAGLFCFNVNVMLSTLYKLVPEYQIEIPKMMADAEMAEPKFLPEFFSVLPKLSIDRTIIEHGGNVYVHGCHFGWADLGTWGTLSSDLERTDEEGNYVMETPVLLSNCKDNVVNLPEGRKAVIEGLENYLVAEQGDVLLICPKDPATVRRLMNDAHLQLGVE